MRQPDNHTFDARLWFAAAIMQTDCDMPRHHRRELVTQLSVEDCPKRKEYVEELLEKKGLHLDGCTGKCRCDWHGTKWCKGKH